MPLCRHRKPFECHIRLSMARRYGNLYNNIHGQIKFIGKTLLVKKKKNVILVVGWKQKVTRFIHRRAHVESSCQRVTV